MTLQELKKQPLSVVNNIWERWLNREMKGKTPPDEREIYQQIYLIWKEKQQNTCI